MPRFSEVAILGFKAKLLDQKMHEADAALDRLKALTVIVARATYESLTYGNRMTDFPLASKQRTSRELDNIMSDLGIDKAQLKGERDQFLRFHMYDVVSLVALPPSAFRAARNRPSTRRSSRSFFGSPQRSTAP